MRQATIRATDLMLLVGTRVALGVGIGLLLSTRLDLSARKSAGLALFAVGVLTTVPILLNVRSGQRGLEHERAGSLRGGVGPEGERRVPGASSDAPAAP